MGILFELPTWSDTPSLQTQDKHENEMFVIWCWLCVHLGMCTLEHQADNCNYPSSDLLSWFKQLLNCWSQLARLGPKMYLGVMPTRGTCATEALSRSQVKEDSSVKHGRLSNRFQYEDSIEIEFPVHASSLATQHVSTHIRGLPPPVTNTSGEPTLSSGLLQVA